MLSSLILKTTHASSRLSSLAGGLFLLSVGLVPGNVNPAIRTDPVRAPAVGLQAGDSWQDITPELLYRNATSMGRVSNEQMSRSIAESIGRQKMVEDVHRYLVDYGILPPGSPLVRVLFLQGLSGRNSLGGGQDKSFALAISEPGQDAFLVVSADAFAGLSEREAFALWMTQKDKIKDFDKYYYTGLSFVSFANPTLIVLNLQNEVTGALAQAKINVDTGTLRLRIIPVARDPRVNPSPVFQSDQAMHNAPVSQGTVLNGGIDFDSDRLDLQIKNAGAGVRFNIDPDMLRRVEGMPGSAPVVIEMKPLASVQSFLCIQNN
ncbi:MAG: hypothetical protein HGA80_08185 [Candidatus Omnitrophica bacterium]|nr:hypothetical protein [Candidatus Omnitrophota bacterium]